ncbi:uncharacterized protein LOC142321970 [Lycorma delicatula]|uniref:uncharacterized protein LOC142321970 n=1 Tax=Lycorma delicatula TaxID=130591 RepID=UPI003F515779
MKFYILLAVILFLKCSIGNCVTDFKLPSIDSTLKNIEGNLQQSKFFPGNLIKFPTPCKCSDNKCSCEFSFIVENPLNVHHGKIVLENDVDNKLVASLKIDEVEKRENVNAKSGIDLPLCVPVPQFPVLEICLILYDVKLDLTTGAHICLSVELRISNPLVKVTLTSISFGCVNLNRSQIEFVSPDKKRPSFIQFHVGNTPKIEFFSNIPVGAVSGNKSGKNPLFFGNLGSADKIISGTNVLHDGNAKLAISN